MNKPNINLCQSCGKKTKKRVCNVCVGLVLKPIKEAVIKEKTEKSVMRIEVKSNENRKELQKGINKLAKMIDEKFGFNTCIDCKKPFGKQIDAAHYHDLSTNRGVRFDLNNLHSAKSECNQYSSKHKAGYTNGLENRYGIDYLQYVESLEKANKDLKLNAFELAEKKELVRKLIRTFDTLQFESSLDARKKLNTIIGIYK